MGGGGGGRRVSTLRSAAGRANVRKTLDLSLDYNILSDHLLSYTLYRLQLLAFKDFLVV